MLATKFETNQDTNEDQIQLFVWVKTEGQEREAKGRRTEKERDIEDERDREDVRKDKRQQRRVAFIFSCLFFLLLFCVWFDESRK